jgi:hypothetical protein
MFANQPQHGCLEMSRRSFLATLIGIPIMGTTVPALGTPGFYVTGVVTASETEDDSFHIGHEFGISARPLSQPHRILRTFVNQKVQVHVELA